MPGHALAQLERDGLAVGRGLPAFGQHADRLAVGVEIDQRLLDLAADDVDAGRGLQARIELPLLGAEMDREDAALARRRLREGELRPQHVCRDGGARHQDGAAGEVHDGVSCRGKRMSNSYCAVKLTMVPFAALAGTLTMP